MDYKHDGPILNPPRRNLLLNKNSATYRSRLLLGRCLLRLWARSTGIKGRIALCGCVVRTGLAVFVGLGLQGVFVLRVLCCLELCSLGEGAGDDGGGSAAASCWSESRGQDPAGDCCAEHGLAF